MQHNALFTPADVSDDKNLFLVDISGQLVGQICCLQIGRCERHLTCTNLQKKAS